VAQKTSQFCIAIDIMLLILILMSTYVFHVVQWEKNLSKKFES